MLRRGIPVGLLVVTLLASVVVAGAAPVGPSERRPAAAPTIHERTTFDRTPAIEGSVEVTIGYDVPSSVTELEVRVHLGAREGVEVVETDGFDRSDGWTFTWTGSGDPSIRLRLPVGESVSEGPSPRPGVERTGWAFVPIEGLGTSSRWRYYGSKPTFEQRVDVAGEGYATETMVYMGPNRVVRNGSGDGAVVVVTPDAADPAASPERMAAFLSRLQRRFELGTRRPAVAIVLPNGSVSPQAPLGLTSQRTFWVRDAAFERASVGNTPAHEFVHTRFGSVGEGRIQWLREASAEYYGALLSMNDGAGTFDEFHDRMNESTPETASVVLADPATFAHNDGEYVAGERVLAALDVQIRRRTDGRRSLADVFRNHTDPESGFVSFDSASAFRQAVVRVSGDPSLGEWIDRYTTTTDRPTIPDEPARFVTDPSLDPDGDGLDSRTEVQAGTDPFAADTDGDGLDDARERALGTDATAADTDGDGLDDGVEVDRGLDPTSRDTDGDGIPDGEDAYPTDASRSATPTETAPRDGGDDLPPLAVWSVLGLWVIAGLAGLSSVGVAGARGVYALSGRGAWLAERSLLWPVLVGVVTLLLSLAIVVVLGG